MKLNRRLAVATLGLGWNGLSASTGVLAQVPALSTAALGTTVAPGWRHQTLPKVKHANDFSIVSDAGQHVLRVRSSSSASSWVTRVNIDPMRLPILRWRWKVSHALARSDMRTKQGDDYAARLYVFFDLPPQRLSLGDRMRLHTARLLSGAKLPAAALCYVWGRAQTAGSSAWNAYSDRLRMIVSGSGNTHAKQWRSVARNVVSDWADAFGGPAPRVSGVGIGADTDNTDDQVEAWFGDLNFTKQP